ncbi:autotransporter domain-containing protein [uncultured Cohaesibacter sp.]|uniref:autotransporter family protein n=1 Tax=uncultured Cohaesibacter sp. TaxID=1002546 RepID=UPI0029C7CE21|nr:autotransporter domain-containing protein [uncultured Cohaesibacter sp.]
MVLGQEANSIGTATFSGEGTVVTLIGATSIGSRGTGTMSIFDDATVKTENIDTITVGEFPTPPSPYEWQGHGTGTISIGGIYDATSADQDARASGTLNASYIAFGEGERHLQFNITDKDLYTFKTGVKGAGDITVYNGDISLTGDYSQYTGDVTVRNGLLSVDTASFKSSAITVDKNGSLRVNGSVTGAANTVTLNGGSLVNNGTISGSDYGAVLSSTGSQITNAGKISGGTGAIFYATGGNSLSVMETATFGNLVDFNNTTGNSTIFGTGSYSVDVANYSTAGNQVTLSNSRQTVVYDSVATSGTMSVVDTGAAMTMSSAVKSLNGSIGSTVDDVLAVNVQRNTPVYDTPNSDKALGYAAAKDDSEGEKAIATLVGDDLAVDPFGNLFWLRAFAGRSFDDFSDIRTRHGGFAFGMDHLFDETRLGAMGGYSKMKNWTDDGGSETSGDIYFGGAYLRQPISGFTFDASVVAGGINTHSERQVNAGTETAQGRFDGWFISPEVALSKAYGLPLDWTLTPKGSISYTHAFFEGYDESGSSMNVSYANRASDAVEGSVEVKLSRQYTFDGGQVATIALSGALVDTYNLSGSTLNASIAGTDFSDSTLSGRNQLGARLGLYGQLDFNSQMSLYAGAKMSRYTDDSWDYSGNMGFKVRF